MFKDLDPMLHSQVRLAIMSILIGVKSADFKYLQGNIKTTKGNLSFQLSKLQDSGYIEIQKSFKGNYPLTSCKITDEGIEAYEAYVDSISDYLKEFNKYKNNQS